MKITRRAANVHTFDCEGKEAEFLLISDVHWDNPKCDRDLLTKHLKEAVERNAYIIINGDFFCLMQGKGDPRRSKDDIRPEHNKGNYLQAVVNDAVQWWKPYAKNLALIGYGNHETGVIKNLEFDALQMFVTLLNHECGTDVQAGGYGGAILFGIKHTTSLPHRMRFAMHYYHGSGGGGPVTKGVIQDQRIMAMVEGYDCTWQGHVHELYHHINIVTYLNRNDYMIRQRPVHQLRTATYKEEYQGGIGGFHVEKGRPPKPLGGYWMKLKLIKIRTDKIDTRAIDATFTTTSIR
jgi:hypothetical protein